MANLLHKVKDALSGGDSHTAESKAAHHTPHDTTGAHGAHHVGTTGSHNTAGPHDSNIANKADPRVDSDLDGSRSTGTTGTGYGSNTTGTTTGHPHHHDTTTAGPHSSNLANKADPRVDSDLDGSRRTGTTGAGYGSNTTGSGLTGNTGTTGSHIPGSGLTGNTGTTGTGYGSNTTGSGLTGNAGHQTAGPHSSNLANKADPRVDSDRDGSHGVGTTGYGSSTGTTGSTGQHHHGHHGKHEDIIHGGPHHTETANKLDPYISGGKGIGTEHASVTGHSSTTAGPHSSNLANKADPRVDSDRDGSHLGGNTGAGYGSNTGTTGAGYGSTTGTGSGHGSNTTGTGYGSSTGNTGTTGTGYGSTTGTGSGHGSNTTGTGYGSSTGNTGTTGTGYGSTPGTGSGYDSNTTGTGYGSSTGNTAGPHKSGLLNKVDPRVDSDQSGSSTTGRHSVTPKNSIPEPLDAAKHKPSDFAAVHGDPVISHGDLEHKRVERHASGTNYGKYGSGAH